MRLKTFALAFICIAFLFSCTSSPDDANNKFKDENLAKCQIAFHRIFRKSLDTFSINIITLEEVKSVVKKFSWGELSVPCEITEITGRKSSVIDPVPAAFEIFDAQGKGQSLIYIPTGKVSCPSPNNGYFLDDKDCHSAIVCSGQKGNGEAPCLCDCNFVCGGASRECPDCRH